MNVSRPEPLLLLLAVLSVGCEARADLADDDVEHSDDTFRPFVRPSDALGVFTESLDRRFDNMDDGFRGKLLDAMRWEDGRLRTFVEKAQLDAWYRTTRDCAEKTVAVAYDRLTAERKAQQQQVVNGMGAKIGGGLFAA